MSAQSRDSSSLHFNPPTPFQLQMGPKGTPTKGNYMKRFALTLCLLAVPVLAQTPQQIWTKDAYITIQPVIDKYVGGTHDLVAGRINAGQTRYFALPSGASDVRFTNDGGYYGTAVISDDIYLTPSSATLANVDSAAMESPWRFDPSLTTFPAQLFDFYPEDGHSWCSGELIAAATGGNPPAIQSPCWPGSTCTGLTSPPATRSPYTTTCGTSYYFAFIAYGSVQINDGSVGQDCTDYENTIYKTYTNDSPYFSGIQVWGDTGPIDCPAQWAAQNTWVTAWGNNLNVYESQGENTCTVNFLNGAKPGACGGTATPGPVAVAATNNNWYGMTITIVGNDIPTMTLSPTATNQAKLVLPYSVPMSAIGTGLLHGNQVTCPGTFTPSGTVTVTQTGTQYVANWTISATMSGLWTAGAHTVYPCNEYTGPVAATFTINN